tara:strand:- start:4039 stop:4284 length:246 start_codon:yes stop_codon:yes gene_type:complete
MEKTDPAYWQDSEESQDEAYEYEELLTKPSFEQWLEEHYEAHEEFYEAYLHRGRQLYGEAFCQKGNDLVAVMFAVYTATII